METANINGAELEYEARGSGEPVLLISLGPIADSFLPVFSEKALTDRYRLIAYRQRRLTAGANGPTPVSFAGHAADAAELLGHLGVRRAHIAGHSSGAAIALQLAVDCPEIVHSLALLEPPLLGVPSAGAFFEKLGPALAAYGSGDRDGAMARFMSVVCTLDWETCRRVIDEHVPGGAAWAVKNADNFFESYLAALNTWQFGPEQAGAISQPILSVVGSETQQLFAESHEMLHSWLPQTEDCRIAGVGHLLHLQDTAPVAQGLAAFFARHPISAGK